MTCPPEAEFLRQFKAETFEAWFTLHLLVCEECCLKYLFGCLARDANKKLKEGEEGSYWESMDPQARDWMTWMSRYQDFFPETSN